MLYTDPNRAIAAMEREIEKASDIKTGEQLLIFAKTINAISADATFGAFRSTPDTETIQKMRTMMESAIAHIHRLFDKIYLSNERDIEAVKQASSALAERCQALQELLKNP